MEDRLNTEPGGGDSDVDSGSGGSEYSDSDGSAYGVSSRFVRLREILVTDSFAGWLYHGRHFL